MTSLPGKLTFRDTCDGIPWERVRNALREAGMGFHEPQVHEKAFRNSFAVVFVFHEESLIGFGRAISDGAYQAAIYDMVVLPAYQRQRVGAAILERLLQKTGPACNVILYANPGKEEFYASLGFRFLKTGMARFMDNQKMQDKGILL